MIARTSSHLLSWWAARRRRALERAWVRPAAVQEACLLALVSAARDTEFGVGHGFDRIRSVAEYVERVPLRGYPEFQPLWERALWGERDVTWPGEVRHWASAGATWAWWHPASSRCRRARSSAGCARRGRTGSDTGRRA